MSEELPGRDHYNTCTHRVDGVILVQEAEQAVIYWDPLRERYHISVREGHWFSCRTISARHFEMLSPLDLIREVGDKAKFLRSLQE